MARHLNRARVVSVNGEQMRSITFHEAMALVESGQAVRLSSNEDLSRGRPLRIQMRIRRLSCRVIATLTARDMTSNAEAVEEGRFNRARNKVDAWAHVHDTRAVTIVAGRGVFTPDPKEASSRAKKMLKAWRQARKATA